MKTILLLLLLLSPSAWAVIFFNTADPAHNRETAPAGALAGSGWQYQGLFGNFLGTAISSNHFITAAHLSASPTTFVSKNYFNGGMTDITYTINTTANSGVGYWNIAGTDLRIFQINETFSSYAPLYTANNELGKDLVVMGRGTQRGATVKLGGSDIGWGWGTSDRKARWGTNQVAATVASGGADYLYATLDAAVGGDEAHLSGGDSGGAVFIQDGGIWKLAGINYAVDGPWQYTDLNSETEFNAALYDARGMYYGSDADGWTLVSADSEPVPSGFYSTRISSYQNQINAITGVPEPRCITLVAFAGLILLRRDRTRPSDCRLARESKRRVDVVSRKTVVSRPRIPPFGTVSQRKHLPARL